MSRRFAVSENWTLDPKGEFLEVGDIVDLPSGDTLVVVEVEALLDDDGRQGQKLTFQAQPVEEAYRG